MSIILRGVSVFQGPSQMTRVDGGTGGRSTRVNDGGRRIVPWRGSGSSESSACRLLS